MRSFTPERSVRMKMVGKVFFSALVAFTFLYILDGSFEAGAQQETGIIEEFAKDNNLPPSQISMARALDAMVFSQPVPGSAWATMATALAVEIRNIGQGSGNPAAIRKALSQLTGEEAITPKTGTTELNYTQMRNIGTRIAALRSGAVRSLLSFNIDGGPATGLPIAGFFPYGGASGEASDQGMGISEKFGVFVNGKFGFGGKDATFREDGFDFDKWGITAGADYRVVDNLVLGAAFGYGFANADLDKNAGELDVDSYSLSLYGTYSLKQFYMDAIFTYAWNSFDSTRNLNFVLPVTGLTVDRTNEADYDGDQPMFSIGGGYDFNFGSLTLGPYVRMNYTHIDIDGYREHTGSVSARDNAPGRLTLNVDSMEIDSLTSVLGAQASYAISTGIGVFLPHISIDWEHEFENDPATIITRTTGPIQVAKVFMDGPDRDFFNLAVGVSGQFAHGFAAFAQYETVLDLDNITDNEVTFGIRYQF